MTARPERILASMGRAAASLGDSRGDEAQLEAMKAFIPLPIGYQSADARSARAR